MADLSEPLNKGGNIPDTFLDDWRVWNNKFIYIYICDVRRHGACVYNENIAANWTELSGHTIAGDGDGARAGGVIQIWITIW